ncbi:sulfatase [Photobacterium sagamiensis]|uniref:sulfatase family protein n=1 Tax=Photobacterium sagamiensis TaxID=2910241 RepID=UPI003D12FE8B
MNALKKTGLAVATAMAMSPALAADQPNILFLVAEDLSPRIGAYGDEIAETPNIDKLVAKGVKYTNVYTAAGVSAPSRAALITGAHPNAIGAGGMRPSDYHLNGGTRYLAVPPEEIKAFPELLRKAGYWTYENNKLDYQFSEGLPETGPFTIWDKEGNNNTDLDWTAAKEDKPWFGMYAYLETHESGLLPRWDFDQDIMAAVMGIMQWKWHLGYESNVTPEDVTIPPYYPDSPGIRETIAQQYNNVATMDTIIGDLLAKLEADGEADDTIIIWTTDHGDGFPRVKREGNNVSLQVPMTIYWPEKWRPKHIKPGTTDDQIISFIDLAPTILAMGGAEQPDFMIGNNFVQENGGGREYYFAAADRIEEAEERTRTVSDSKYKLILNYLDVPSYQYSGFRAGMPMMRDLLALHEAGSLNEEQEQFFKVRPKEQFFDLSNDPYELNNVIDEPQYAEDIERLRSEMARWQSEVADYAVITEKELALQFWPDGIQPITESSELKIEGGKIVITNSNPAASVGYRVNGGDWKLYTGPIEIKDGLEDVITKAVRYGWAESEETYIKL